MSDPKTQQEPTMEEILASIRRIISEDDKAAPAAGEDAAAAAPAPVDAAEEEAPPPPPPPPMPRPAAKPAVAAAPPPPPLPPMPKAQPAAAAAPAMRAVEPAPAADVGEPSEFDDSVLELTEIIEEGAEAPPAPPPKVERPKPRIVPAPEPEPELEPEAELEPAMMAAPRMATSSAAAMRGGMDLSALVSDATAAAAETSFAGFANQVQQTMGVALGGGTRTLEELVKDLLRPMLKDWLDRNLPPLVQRLVEREIAKLAGRAEEK